MGISWSPDGKQVLTASADKTVKLWDVEKNTAISTFTFGEDLEFQQLGCLWQVGRARTYVHGSQAHAPQGKHLLSVGLNGYINYLDVNTPDRPLRIVKVLWCGVVWCGVVWCGVVWCGVVWCGVVWLTPPGCRQAHHVHDRPARGRPFLCGKL